MNQRKIFVMINGLPKNMPSLMESAIAKNAGYQVIYDSLTGPDTTEKFYKDVINLHTPRYHEETLERVSSSFGGRIIAIDFTEIIGNVDIYCKNKIPFIMVTTGGDRDALSEIIEESEISAVIAPNMSTPIVMLMDILKYATDHYPNAIDGWKIRIIGHQAKKKGANETTMTIGNILKSMGLKCVPKNIRLIQEKIEQRLMSNPANVIDEHGWHEYSLLSPDGNVELKFKRNANRSNDVDGTLMALDFLTAKMERGVRGKCFSMHDVIRE